MRDRAAALLLQVGLLAVALVALPYKLFELDRYLMPREALLHAVALALLALRFPRLREHRLDRIDLLLAAFLAWSAASALFATNPWLAQRALGVSVSSAVVFRAARDLARSGHADRLIAAGAFAVVVAAALGLAQAYGVRSAYFSLNRAPGGTFGNRNFLAHFVAIGLPALAYQVLAARRSAARLLALGGAALAGALLLLTRSRAAWLAVLVSLAIATATIAAVHLRDRAYGSRARQFVLAIAVGAGVALVVPNALRWSSGSPYLDSARGVVDYRSGSGRGRVAQYGNSLRMAMSHPALGVGPGNWSVRYPGVAPANDPSLNAEGMAANPWPSSDWVAYTAERGFMAAVMLALVFMALLWRGVHRTTSPDAKEVLRRRLVLVATAVATLVVGAFDAVLLLGAPALLAWTLMGAAEGEVPRVPTRRPVGRAARIAVAAIALVVAASFARAVLATAAIARVGFGTRRAAWLAAADLDPGSYRIRLRAAELLARRGACAAARPHARAARDLYPLAVAPRHLLRQCS